MNIVILDSIIRQLFLNVFVLAKPQRQQHSIWQQVDMIPAKMAATSFKLPDITLRWHGITDGHVYESLSMASVRFSSLLTALHKRLSLSVQ